MWRIHWNSRESAYQTYFGVHWGDRDESWAPHKECKSSLNQKVNANVWCFHRMEETKNHFDN